jgi:hypothetical protein
MRKGWPPAPARIEDNLGRGENESPWARGVVAPTRQPGPGRGPDARLRKRSDGRRVADTSIRPGPDGVARRTYQTSVEWT